MTAAWDPETRARAIAIGRRDGWTAAEKATGVPSSTIKSWDRRDPATDAEAALGEALEADQEAAGALSDDEWGALQRATAQRYRTLLARGDTLGAQRLSIALGVCDSKLAERAQRETARPAVDLGGPAGRTRLERVVQRFTELGELQQVYALRTADDVALEVEIGKRRAVVTRMRREVRWLREERLRRAAGLQSLFDAVQWPPAGVTGRVERPLPEHLVPGADAPLTPKIVRPVGGDVSDEEIAAEYDGKVAESRRDPKVIPFRRRGWPGGSVQSEIGGIRPGIDDDRGA